MIQCLTRLEATGIILFCYNIVVFVIFNITAVAVKTLCLAQLPLPIAGFTSLGKSINYDLQIYSFVFFAQCLRMIIILN